MWMGFGYILLLSFLGDAAVLAGTVSNNSPAMVMQNVRDRYAGQDSSGKYIMRIHDASGNVRKRKVKILYRDEKAIRKTVIRIESPASESGTAFLSYSYARERDDDQWLYLPSLRRTRQIANEKRTGAFLGSDFTYADMERFSINNYELVFLGKGEILGREVLKIQAIPKNENIMKKVGYAKRVLWVDPELSMILKELNYDMNSLPLKEISTLDVKVVASIATPALIRAKNLQEGSYTDLELQNISYNVGLGESMFSRHMLQYLR